MSHGIQGHNTVVCVYMYSTLNYENLCAPSIKRIPPTHTHTQTDGLVSDYDNLPSNITASGEFAYENPGLPSTATLLSTFSTSTPSHQIPSGPSPYDNIAFQEYDNQEVEGAYTNQVLLETSSNNLEVSIAIHLQWL